MYGCSVGALAEAKLELWLGIYCNIRPTRRKWKLFGVAYHLGDAHLDVGGYVIISEKNKLVVRCCLSGALSLG